MLMRLVRHLLDLDATEAWMNEKLSEAANYPYDDEDNNA